MPPKLLTPEVHEAIVQAVRTGMHESHAALYAGILPETYYAWRARGRAALARAMADGIDYPPSEEPYVRLVEDVALATGELAAEAHNVIYTAAQRDPHWARWLLERRFPNQYSGKPDTQIEAIAVSSNGSAVTVSASLSGTPSTDDKESERTSETRQRLADLVTILRGLAEAGALGQGNRDDDPPFVGGDAPDSEIT